MRTVLGALLLMLFTAVSWTAGAATFACKGNNPAETYDADKVAEHGLQQDRVYCSDAIVSEPIGPADVQGFRIG